MSEYMILELYDGNGQIHKNSGKAICPAAVSLYF